MNSEFISLDLPRVVAGIKCLEANALIRAITQRILMQAFTRAVLAPLKYTCLPAVLASGLTGRNFPQWWRNETYIK